jgi:hypothetical protein
LYLRPKGPIKAQLIRLLNIVESLDFDVYRHFADPEKPARSTP